MINFNINMDQEKIWNSIALPWKKFRAERIIEVSDFLKNKKGKILDLGCGSGRNFAKIDGVIYGVDFSEKMLKYAREYADKNNINVKLRKAPAYGLPFQDNFFDSAIFIASLHCIETAKKREKTLKELLRVLKPNSEAIISVWDYNQKKFNGKEKESFILWEHNGEKYRRYYYLYDKKEIIGLLNSVGFKLIKVMDKENSSGAYSKKNIIIIVKK